MGKDWFSGPSAYNAPLTEEIQRAAHSMGLGSRTGGLEVFTAPFVRAIRKVGLLGDPLPKTNMDPGPSWPLEDGFPLPTSGFQGRC